MELEKELYNKALQFIAEKHGYADIQQVECVEHDEDFDLDETLDTMRQEAKVLTDFSQSLQPILFKVATEDSPEVLEKCCDNPNCRDTINYNKAPSISKPELNLNKAKDMLTRLVSQLGNEHVSEEYCEPLIEESQQLLSKLNKD